MTPSPLAAGSLMAVFLFHPMMLVASSPADIARADALCATSKEAARRAAEEDRRAGLLDQKAQSLTQEASRLQMQVNLSRNEQTQAETTLDQLRSQVRRSAQQTQAALQSAESQFAAIPSADDASSRRARTYVQSVLARLRQFANGLGQCAENPQFCSSPTLVCPAPPDVSLSPGGGANSAFVRQVEQSNRRFVQEYYQSCQKANQSAAQTVEQMRMAQRKADSARQRHTEATRLKQETDLQLQRTRLEAQTAHTQAQRLGTQAKSEAQQADRLAMIRDYCRTPLKDYSAKIQELRAAAEQSEKTTDQLMKPTGGPTP